MKDPSQQYRGEPDWISAGLALVVMTLAVTSALLGGEPGVVWGAIWGHMVTDFVARKTSVGPLFDLVHRQRRLLEQMHRQYFALGGEGDLQ